MPDQQTCYVISPTAPPGRKLADNDQVFKYIIKPAMEACGYTCAQTELDTQSGLITPEALQHLITDPLTVIDLTDPPPGVFYQLGIRHMVRLPVIQIIQEDKTVPQEIADLPTIVYELSLEGAEVAKERLIQVIRFIEHNRDKLPNPITSGIELHALSHSDNPVERSHAQMLYLLQMVNAKVDALSTGRQITELDYTGFAEVWVDLKNLEALLDVGENVLLNQAQLRRAHNLVLKVQRTLGITLAVLAESTLEANRDKEAAGQEGGDGEALGRALANLYKVTTQPLSPLDDSTPGDDMP